MTQFAVGDRVRVIGPSSSLWLGAVGTVTAVGRLQLGNLLVEPDEGSNQEVIFASRHLTKLEAATVPIHDAVHGWPVPDTLRGRDLTTNEAAKLRALVGAFQWHLDEVFGQGGVCTISPKSPFASLFRKALRLVLAP